MLFTSAEYLLFYVSIAFGSWLVGRWSGIRVWLLLIASYYFYASNNGWLVLLIAFSTVVDYSAAIWIEEVADRARKRLLLLLSLGVNLSVLGFFKYFNFFLATAADIGQLAGHDMAVRGFEIALPVGISFYTFESLSYVIDVYRGELKAERRLHRYALFIAYFPHLIAGPIIRPGLFIKLLERPPRLFRTTLEGALSLIALGLFKKIVLADSLAGFVDQGFAGAATADALTAWVALYAFAFQIFFDFSGYTDVAIGCSMLLGFRLPPNFRRPYAALSITEFWRRWHLSLSFWLRDYLYKALGGNRMATPWGVYRNLLVTMLLGGLWHGAAWTFVLWGAVHGLLLSVERLLGQVRLVRHYHGRPVARVLRALLVFHVIVLTWLPFRAEGMGQLADMAAALLRFDAVQTVTVGALGVLAVAALGWALQVASDMLPLRRAFLRLPVPVKGLAYGGVAAAVIVFASRGAQPFLYFAF